MCWQEDTVFIVNGEPLGVCLSQALIKGKGGGVLGHHGAGEGVVGAVG